MAVADGALVLAQFVEGSVDAVVGRGGVVLGEVRAAQTRQRRSSQQRLVFLPGPIQLPLP